jgi:hypothetical protein
MVVIKILKIAEPIAVYLQKQYMKNSITSETVTSSYLAFHPVDYRKKTLSLYNKRINEKI